MAMLPIIVNTSFERLAIIDDYISFIWTPRYYTPGDFELCVPIRYADLMQPDFYIVRDDDENVGIIESLDIQQTEDGQEMIIASGRFLSAILERRIVAVQTQFNSKYPGEIAESLIDANIINASPARRQIPGFVLSDFDRNLGSQTSIQYTGDNLLTAISNLCKEENLGFKVTFNGGSGFIFSIYEGKDRTYDQTENPYMIFSPEYGNLLTAEFTENHSGIINGVLAAGEGEGVDRKTIWVYSTGSPAGLNLREFYKDARNVQSNSGAISPVNYMAQLAGAGREALTGYSAAFVGTVDFSAVRYKTDVNLGDLCVIENKRWGISVKARLLEVIESTDETGLYSITPSFGFE